ncbi:hypothetical protein C5D09_07245 [Rathayibacter sp. AY1C9]|nr:hypothetical protein C5D09_07245 [Rathayibacter sp. AY1C9]
MPSPADTAPSSQEDGVSASALDAICEVLGCQVGDILTHVPDDVGSSTDRLGDRTAR